MAPTLRLVGEDVLFASWPVSVEELESIIPEPLAVDTHNNTGWVTILAHEVTSAGLDALPVSQLPAFGEVDLRTYVTHNDESGVFFISCNTSQRINSVLGEQSFGLPFQNASINFDHRGSDIILRSAQGKSAGTGRYDVMYRPTGDATAAESGSLAEFLVERHTYFTPSEEPRSLGKGTVERDPWQLAPVDAEIRTNTLLETIGLEPPSSGPVFHYSPRFESRFVDRETLRF